MNVSLIQTTLHWEGVRKIFRILIRSKPNWRTYRSYCVAWNVYHRFTMNPEKVAENWNRQTLAWMKKGAWEIVLQTGSVAVEEEGKYYNRLFWVKPGGDFSSYNKRHLFRMAKRKISTMPRRSRLVENIKGWNICPLVCYDLRFPVWSRNRFNKTSATRDYDVLILCCQLAWSKKLSLKTTAGGPRHWEPMLRDWPQPCWHRWQWVWLFGR